MNGSALQEVPIATLRNFKIALPPTSTEQAAIAEALSDVDALIESLEQLLAKKREVKQGAMQELLTGNRRLAGFQVQCGYTNTEIGPIPMDWTLSTVGNEFSIQLGKMLDAEKNSGSLKPYLGNRAVQWGRIDLSDLEEIRLTDADIQKYKLHNGDLLVCEGGEVGRAAIWREPMSECYFQKALHRLRPRSNYSAELLLNVLQLYGWSGKLLNYVTQTSIAHLPKDKFQKLPIPKPATISEQTAIIQVLSDMDLGITELETILAKARQIKQAMMQELLTGRIRLM